jgi:hypothetical protein
MDLPFDKNTKLTDLTAGQFGNLISITLMHVQKQQIANIGENIGTVIDSMMENAPAMIDKFQEIDKLIEEKAS